MSDDILDSVLDLEEESYQAGFEEGKADGAEAGYAEANTFGFEKGYQKALEMGKLHGRALTLNAFLANPNLISNLTANASLVGQSIATLSISKPEENHQAAADTPSPPTPSENPRLKKHVDLLLRLTDPGTLSIDNSDESVEAFDDRMKKAVAKAKVIDRMIAGPYNMTISGDDAAIQSPPAAASGNIEELGNAAVRR
jgi:Essential protein Yae1, N terminal